MKDPILFTFVVLVIGIFATWAITYLYYRIPPKKPFFTYGSLTFDTSKIAGLGLTYNKECFNRLTRTLLIFWNGGTQTIEKGDIEGEKLKINFQKDTKVLKAQILYPNIEDRQVCKFNAEEMRTDSGYTNSARLEFSFVGPKKGVVVEILHTGAQDEKPVFERTFKHGEIKIKGPLISPRRRKSIDILTKIYLGLGILSSVACLIGILWFISYEPSIKIKLEKLPEGVQFPNSLKEMMSYNANEKCLIFKGPIKEKEIVELLTLSQEPSYQKAIVRLFRVSPTSTPESLILLGGIFSFSFLGVSIPLRIFSLPKYPKDLSIPELEDIRPSMRIVLPLLSKTQ